MSDDHPEPNTQLPETAPASVSEWVQGLKAGDQVSAQELWTRYFDKLIAHVEKHVRRYNCPSGNIVSEDIAASVFESICNGAQAGRFRDVTNRDELWWLLLTMTRRKVIDHIRHATASRRFPGKQTVSLTGTAGDLYRQLVSDEPTAEYAVMFQEQYAGLLKRLRDDKLRQIAVLKIEGFTNEEIQKEVGISSATMTRKLKLIRETWREALADQGSEHGTA